MSEIKWTKCSEEMPPYDLDYKIITIDDMHGLRTDDGKSLNSIKDFCVDFNAVWTTYTDEKWEELNKC